MALRSGWLGGSPGTRKLRDQAMACNMLFLVQRDNLQAELETVIAPKYKTAQDISNAISSNF